MSMLHRHVHLYCERTNDSLWGEPANTLSSLGFFLAAWLLWNLYRKQDKKVPGVMPLIVLSVAIGAGSMLFHTLATFGSIAFDVIPILLFVCMYTYLFARLLLGMRSLTSTLVLCALIGINVVYKYFVFRAMDGYVSYIPTFIFLLVLTLILLLKRHHSSLKIVSACIVACASLYFRITDRQWCGVFPLGTHFLWHLLNAVVVYILVSELMLYRTDTRH